MKTRGEDELVKLCKDTIDKAVYDKMLPMLVEEVDVALYNFS